jgi:hypothetical protein
MSNRFCCSMLRRCLLRTLCVSLSCATVFVATAADAERPPIPSRPAYPVKMDELCDADFGRMFFAEIDLDYPGLDETRAAVERSDYTAALAAWSRVFLGRMQAVPLVTWPWANWYPVDLPMTADRVILQHGSSPQDFGPPGQMSWYELKHWQDAPGAGLHVNCMWHTKSLIAKVEENCGKPTVRVAAGQRYTNEQLYTRWAAIWRDFVNNNWRAGMPLAAEPELRRQRLAAAGLVKEPSEWGSAIAFRQQVIVAWMVGNWFTDTQHAIQAAPAEFSRHVPPRVVAEMVYFMVVWPVENLTDSRRTSPDALAEGCPNQSQEKSLQLLRVAAVVPEFRRGQDLLGLCSRLIKTILGVDGHFSLRTDQQADGSGTELSYNYMTSLVHAAEGWVPVAETLDPRPDWLPSARHALTMRRRFLANLGTPTGMQPLCKGSHGDRPAVPLVGRDGATPAYTSIAFPYHGLSMMRSGWGERDLYLALVNCRVGHPHAAEDANSLLVEAFGRSMLVHNAGEGFGESPYFGSSWAKNTVHVDGLSQVRCLQPQHGAYTEPQDGRWHTSPDFDFAEATYRYGYGPPPVNRQDKPKTRITDVTHTRQAIFVKSASLWFVIDIMTAPRGIEHDYAQLWHFHKDFPNDTVVVDEATQTIGTADPQGANLFLHQASAVPLSYRRFHGEGWEGAGPRHTGTMPVTVRGWHNTGGGYDSTEIHPAVDVHATWRGTGRQVLVTCVVPSETTIDPIHRCDRIISEDDIGLALQLRNGRKLTCLTARGVAPIRSKPLSTPVPTPVWGLVVVEKTGAPSRGMLLGPDPESRRSQRDVSTCDNEFVIDNGALTPVAPIRVPTGFHWDEAADGLRPAYD